jgi:hypothetical protein
MFSKIFLSLSPLLIYLKVSLFEFVINSGEFYPPLFGTGLIVLNPLQAWKQFWNWIGSSSSGLLHLLPPPLPLTTQLVLHNKIYLHAQLCLWIRMYLWNPESDQVVYFKDGRNTVDTKLLHFWQCCGSDSLNPDRDPAFQVNSDTDPGPIRIQDFADQ